MSQQLQFELWRECNCKCTFCTLGEDNEFTKNEFKLQAMQSAIDEIKNLKPGEHETVGFIGGEFFQGQLNTEEIHDKFMEMIKVTNEALNKECIKSIWLNVSLLIGDQKDLYEALTYIDQKNKLWLLTSYDLLGRFHTDKMKQTWEYHLNKLHELYPQINRNITSILTGTFIRAYLNGDFDLKSFGKKYHATLFFKNPVKPGYLEELSTTEINKRLGYFFPERKEFIDFLKKYIEKEGIDEYLRLMSLDLRADEVRKNYNEEEMRNIWFLRDREKEQDIEISEHWDYNDMLPCGHNDTCKSYCDSDKCILCDKNFIKKLYDFE